MVIDLLLTCQLDVGSASVIDAFNIAEQMFNIVVAENCFLESLLKEFGTNRKRLGQLPK